MTKEISNRRTPWREVVLLCGKCSRKLDGGYGRKRKLTLREAVRAALRVAGHGREIRIIETRCLGVCPKKAVTALNASRPGQLFTIPAGTDVNEAMRVLVGNPPTQPVP